MSVRSAFGIGSLAVLGLASAASAAPLNYDVAFQESNLRVDFGVNAQVDFNPDLTELLPPIGDDFPAFGTMTGGSNTFPSPQSDAVADVGLPGNFNNGASGITFSELEIRSVDIGPLSGIGAVTVPLDLTGSNLQLVAFSAYVTEFTIILDDPFSSALTPTGNPQEWLWAALANVTISGVFTPVVEIPTVQTVELDPVPFSQAVTIPLAGTFSGIPTGTEVTVGIPIDTLENQNLSLPPIGQQFNLAELGLITGFFSLDNLLLTDISTEVVYRNSTPIPEPSTALLLGLGLVGVAVARRRR